ncbi:cobalamin biosynthesis protein [Roseivivax sediminis]|uniref:cobalamin biosynthesis protein n=1 Tax=Roseivivax sediminis TaxID=936889 RepID=UPI00122D21F6
MIVAGFGFRSGVSEGSFADALAKAGGRSPACIATAAAKADDPALQAFAAARGLAVEAVDNAALARQDTRTRSEASQAAHGTGSVAEAAALAAAGPGARLLGSRVVSTDRRATCALAEGGTT